MDALNERFPHLEAGIVARLSMSAPQSQLRDGEIARLPTWTATVALARSSSLLTSLINQNGLSMALRDFQTRGQLGVATFWTHLFLICLSLACAAFSVYWMSLTSSALWIAATDGSLLAANCCLLVFSIASLVFLALYALGIEVRAPAGSRVLLGVAALASQTVLCALLSLATESETALRYGDLSDYCVRHWALEDVKAFLAEHGTEYSIQAYVGRRTRDLYPSAAAFLALWFPATVFFLIVSWRLDPPRKS
jgi:hypothetical protein